MLHTSPHRIRQGLNELADLLGDRRVRRQRVGASVDEIVDAFLDDRTRAWTFLNVHYLHMRAADSYAARDRSSETSESDTWSAAAGA